MFDPELAVGQVLTEKEVHDRFECQTTLGIRKSNKNNLFVIMSGSAKKKIYDDQWVGDTLLYNGTDINQDEAGGQTLKKGKGNNNRQLYEVWETPEESRPQIFLFVKQKANQCVFKGEVYLSEKPYEAPRHDDPTKTVWIFPLTLYPVDERENRENYAKAEKSASSLGIDELYAKVKEKASRTHAEETKKHITTSAVYERDPEIAMYAKRRADAHCDLCGIKAPFLDKNSNPYLEAHHIEWLSEGGADEIDNVVALCPNCHRKMHIVADENDITTLKEVIKRYKAQRRKR